MMRLLHTADWHLGKRLGPYLRLTEQQTVLEEICQIAEAQSVDMVVVAGDLFDNNNPSAEAIELLYKTLKRLTRNATVPVVAIAGNHDSPDRINMADVLARENGIIFIGQPTDTVPIFDLATGIRLQQSTVGFFEITLPSVPYPIRVLHTAFANEVRLKEYFGEDKQTSLQESLARKWEALATDYCNADGVNILTTHLYVLQPGGEVLEEPEGEKPLNIGNADAVFSHAIPRTVQYAALGHLHRCHDVGIHQPVVYSGSPLCYSFSEAGQQKSVSIIEITPGTPVQQTIIPLHSGKPLKRKTVYSFPEAIDWLEANQNSWVELTIVTDTFLQTQERKQLYQTHQGIIHLIPKVLTEAARNTTLKEINLEQDIDTLFKDYFKSRHNGQEPNDEIIHIFHEIVNS